MSYYITTDATCDLPLSMYQDNFKVIPMPYTIENEEYGIEKFLDIKEFYDKIRNGSMPTTSLITQYATEEELRPILQQGYDIIHISFSSALSGTYENACKAVEVLKSEFPDRKIYIIDSKCASLGEAMLVYYCLKARAEGKSVEDNYAYTDEIKDHILHYVAAEDLFHLQRGGRISKTSAVLGTMLHIKPIIYLNKNGKLVNFEKIKGRKKSLLKIIDKMMEKMYEPNENTEVFIAHADALDDAEFVANKITEKTGITNITIDYIGPVIGTHTGTGTVAVFTLGTDKIEPKDETLND